MHSKGRRGISKGCITIDRATDFHVLRHLLTASKKRFDPENNGSSLTGKVVRQMSRLRNAVLLVIWLVVATHIYGLVWSRYPDYFPEYPESVGRFIDWLTRDYQPRGIESLTTYYYLILLVPAGGRPDGTWPVPPAQAPPTRETALIDPAV